MAVSAEANWEAERTKNVEEIRNWMNLNIDTNSSTALYALIDIFQSRINSIDLSDEQKGAILSDVTAALYSNNKISIALFREYKRQKIEGKEPTKQ